VGVSNSKVILLLNEKIKKNKLSSSSLIFSPQQQASMHVKHSNTIQLAAEN
jgi:hypothetical protein